MGLDLWLQRLVNRPGNAALDLVMIGLSSNWVLVPLLAAAALFLALRKKGGWRSAVLLLAVFGISDAVTARVIKPAVHRVRPCNENPPRSITIPSVGCAHGQSFPSGHAANSAAVAAVVGWTVPGLGPLGALIALLIGTSRVYLGVHWPSDVVAGWAFGAALASALVAVARRLSKRAAVL